MRFLFLMLSLLSATVVAAQNKSVAGTFETIIGYPACSIVLNKDSTFEFRSGEHPVFFTSEIFSEKGRWTARNNIIILNPQLPALAFIESELIEKSDSAQSGILLSFRHFKRYFDGSGTLIRTDSAGIDRLDYAFNRFDRKNRRRISTTPTTRCTFAGYIPRELISNEKTASVPRPQEQIRSIYFGCYELQGTKEYVIHGSRSNHLILNVYSNYYQDSQIRQMALRIKGKKLLQIATGSAWVGTKLKKQKSG